MTAAKQFDLKSSEPISPWLEMGAYEALWLDHAASFKSIADKFGGAPFAVPSDFVPYPTAIKYAELADEQIRKFSSAPYGVRIHGAGEYPSKIRVAKHPVELLYYQGYWALSEQPSVAVVGTREPSDAGILQARRIVEGLISEKIIPVSGLAKGIDAIVHETAIELKFPTIAVVGTPISTSYPRENRVIHEKISREHLLISQVPVVAYKAMPLNKTRTFFPERNVTMSALTDATVIVEAGETSGTLTQARAALAQGRPLLILESCFRRPDITWPHRFEELGAIRVSGIEDILANVSALYKDR
ncbi:DNA-processing protein DprA [Mesorhizobium neociceri]|uniref:DNA-protecting protein DprA n=1 Tax=Mesorhizobium neociceri TaxID=1307853 RepID=A0A838B9N1_9HYPH|nr:DNA-processing protein DprA [Mesorhizobium neociceri]MBA1142873.1 DNA-protecting protein DprA [Mesorhizobium neociceri]